MVFSPDLSILPPPQLRLWPELDATPETFTLYGGTALALRLGHRTSVDPGNLPMLTPYLKREDET
ncbi:MAG: hypothetical protein WCI01_00125 [Chlorobiaceae bacterium]